MTNNYGKLISDNLEQVYSNQRDNLAANLQAEHQDGHFRFHAFGKKCVVEPERITLEGQEQASVTGLLISHYCLNANPDHCVLQPLKALKEFPESARYLTLLKTHTERLLVPHVHKIKASIAKITDAFNGEATTPQTGGDFSFIIYPLPKIALCYIFYEADEDFCASVTCLYSNNADNFMPMDGLVDLGEYTSKAMLELID